MSSIEVKGKQVQVSSQKQTIKITTDTSNNNSVFVAENGYGPSEKKIYETLDSARERLLAEQNKTPEQKEKDALQNADKMINSFKKSLGNVKGNEKASERIQQYIDKYEAIKAALTDNSPELKSSGKYQKIKQDYCNTKNIEKFLNEYNKLKSEMKTSKTQQTEKPQQNQQTVKPEAANQQQPVSKEITVLNKKADDVKDKQREAFTNLNLKAQEKLNGKPFTKEEREQKLKDLNGLSFDELAKQTDELSKKYEKSGKGQVPSQKPSAATQQKPAQKIVKEEIAELNKKADEVKDKQRQAFTNLNLKAQEKLNGKPFTKEEREQKLKDLNGLSFDELAKQTDELSKKYEESRKTQTSSQKPSASSQQKPAQQPQTQVQTQQPQSSQPDQPKQSLNGIWSTLSDLAVDYVVKPLANIGTGGVGGLAFEAGRYVYNNLSDSQTAPAQTVQPNNGSNTQQVSEAPKPEPQSNTAAVEKPAGENVSQKKENFHSVKTGGMTWEGIVKTYYPELVDKCGGKMFGADGAIRQLKMALSEGSDIDLVKATDIPKTLNLPLNLNGVEFKDNEYKGAKIRKFGGHTDIAEAGRKTFSA